MYEGSIYIDTRFHASFIYVLHRWYLHCVKSVCVRSFSGSYFPAFRLNTERYGLCGNIRTRKSLRTFFTQCCKTVIQNIGKLPVKQPQWNAFLGKLHTEDSRIYSWEFFDIFRLSLFKPLSTIFAKWPNTLKQFVAYLLTNCFSVFGHFVGLALKSIRTRKYSYFWKLFTKNNPVILLIPLSNHIA